MNYVVTQAFKIPPDLELLPLTEYDLRKFGYDPKKLPSDVLMAHLELVGGLSNGHWKICALVQNVSGKSVKVGEIKCDRFERKLDRKTERKAVLAIADSWIHGAKQAENEDDDEKPERTQPTNTSAPYWGGVVGETIFCGER
jgi:hypothetical protein